MPHTETSETPISINIYTDFTSNQLRVNWLKLEQTGVLSAFQSLQFVELMSQHVLAAHNSVLCIVELVNSNIETIMIMPMVVRRSRYARSLEWLDLGLSDYCLPLFAADLARNTVQMRALFGQIVARLGHIDYVHLTKMPAQFDGVENPLMRLAQVRPMGAATFPKYLGTAEAVSAFRRSGIHEDYRKRLRKLGREGRNPNWTVAKTAEEAASLFSALVRLRKDRFARLKRVDPLQDLAIATFYLALAQSGCVAGTVCLIALRFNDEIVAVQYGLVQADRCVVIMVGAETEAWRTASPGLINFVKLADWTIDQGLKVFDLGVGDLAYKKRLVTDPCPLYEMHHAITAVGLVYVLIGRAKQFLRVTLAAHPQWNQWVRKMFGK